MYMYIYIYRYMYVCVCVCVYIIVGIESWPEWDLNPCDHALTD